MTNKANVKLIKLLKGNGYFLTIGKAPIENTWAVTELEMRMLQKILNDMFV